MKGLKRLLDPSFAVMKTTSVIPMGKCGILRVINSHKLNLALGSLISQQRLDALKERMSLGYTTIALRQKKN